MWGLLPIIQQFTSCFSCPCFLLTVLFLYSQQPRNTQKLLQDFRSSCYKKLYYIISLPQFRQSIYIFSLYHSGPIDKHYAHEHIQYTVKNTHTAFAYSGMCIIATRIPNNTRNAICCSKSRTGSFVPEHGSISTGSALDRTLVRLSGDPYQNLAASFLYQRTER